MMHLLCKYDVARFTRNDAMFAPMCPQAHIIRVSVIISETTSFAEGKHHSKNVLLSGKQKYIFCAPPKAKNLPPATFFNAFCPHRVRIPFDKQNKKDTLKDVFFIWRAVRDSNP